VDGQAVWLALPPLGSLHCAGGKAGSSGSSGSSSGSSFGVSAPGWQCGFARLLRPAP